MFGGRRLSYARGVPTAAHYHDAAQRFRAIAENLMREAGAVGGWVTGFVSDGLVGDAIDASNGRARAHLVTAGEDLQRLARVCDQRGEVCTQYATAVRHYHQLTLVEQLVHGYPIRPASWVEL